MTDLSFHSPVSSARTSPLPLSNRRAYAKPNVTKLLEGRVWMLSSMDNLYLSRTHTPRMSFIWSLNAVERERGKNNLLGNRQIAPASSATVFNVSCRCQNPTREKTHLQLCRQPCENASQKNNADRQSDSKPGRRRRRRRKKLIEFFSFVFYAAMKKKKKKKRSHRPNHHQKSNYDLMVVQRTYHIQRVQLLLFIHLFIQFSPPSVFSLPYRHIHSGELRV